MDAAPLLEIRQVRKAFPKPDGGELLVLDDIDLTLRDGEVVGLLGRSGSGKSTLLRLIAGLSRPVRGSISYLGQLVHGPPPGIAMVFQGFALFPWLTVLENVEIGLEALRLPRDEIRRRSLAAIDLIGLDGFEIGVSARAFGRNASARRICTSARRPSQHSLDGRTFLALDVLTAETLRTDFLDLWSEGQLPIKGVILVTHNIEEAVLMCDRVLVFATNPGRIVTDIRVDLPHPRDRLDPSFRDLVERIYSEMTAKPASERAAPRAERFPGVGIGTIMPRVSTNSLSGLLEAIVGAPYAGKVSLPIIAAALHMTVDDLFPIAETLQMLRFCGDRRRRYRAHPRRQCFRGRRRGRTQTSLLTASANAYRSCSAYPASPRRTPKPQGPTEPLLQTRLKTTCRPRRLIKLCAP